MRRDLVGTDCELVQVYAEVDIIRICKITQSQPAPRTACGNWRLGHLSGARRLSVVFAVYRCPGRVFAADKHCRVLLLRPDPVWNAALSKSQRDVVSRPGSLYFSYIRRWCSSSRVVKLLLRGPASHGSRPCAATLKARPPTDRLPRPQRPLQSSRPRLQCRPRPGCRGPPCPAGSSPPGGC